jgi:hypothetical protein
VFNSRNVEGQAVESPPKKGLSFSTKVKLLLVTGLVGYSLWDWKKSTSKATKTQPTSETPPTNTTPVTSGTQPTNTTPVISGTQPTNTTPVISGTQPTNTTPVISGTQPTNTTPVTSGTQPTNTVPAAIGTSCTAANQQLISEDLTTDPTQVIARREERSPGKYPPADIPGDFHPLSRLNVVVDRIVTTAGHLEAGLFSYNIR